MDIRYLKLRLQTFRREYFDLTSKWVNKSWSWIWQFTIDNFKFLYRGEIHQIKYLSNVIEQQRVYINDIQDNMDKQTHAPPESGNLYDTQLEKTILLIAKLLLIPISFLFYWIRRTIRIVRNQSFTLLVSECVPTEDMPLNESYNGTGKSLHLIAHNARRYPRGLVLFKYTLTISEGSANPVLYIDPGTGISENFSIPLPVNRENTIHELLLEFPPHCKSLILILSNQHIVFELSDISIKETNFLQAAWYLKSRYQYGFNEILHALFIRKMPGVRRPQSYKSTYPEWYECYCRLTNDDENAIKQHIQAFSSQPLISIILLIDNLNPGLLKSCLKSVSSQHYSNWELLILSDTQPDAHVTAVINSYDGNDGRIKLVFIESNAKLSNKFNDAMTLVQGEFTIILESKDILTAHALYLFSVFINNSQNTKILYSDYDHIDNFGTLSDPVFKSNWNYDFFLGKNYIQYLVCYKTALLREIVTISNINPYLQSGELNIRCIENVSPSEISHLPYILLHHRQSKIAISSMDKIQNVHNDDSLTSHLKRNDCNASAIKTEYGHWIKRTVPSPQPLISLIILTRDRLSLLSNCINGILDKTDYKNIEIIIIDNGSQEEATLNYFEFLKNKTNQVKIFRQDSEFNFSELNNIAVEHATGEYIGLINNDISVIQPHWLDEMMSHLIREDVGVVGAKLLYEDDTIQHAGVTIGLGGVAGHSFRYSPRHYRGYDDRLMLCHEVSCVTAACLLTKKSIYKDVNGLNAVNLQVAFNDVDYCLKVRAKGYKIIWTPFAELYHLESASRSSDLSRDNIHRWNSEYCYMRDNWHDILDNDPFYNPNLTIIDEDFSLAIPPRIKHPWTKFTYLESTTTKNGNKQV